MRTRELVVVSIAALAVVVSVAPGATDATGLEGAPQPAVRQQTGVDFTIDQVMSYAFPSGLVAAPTGERIAWLANRQGRRNVWVAEAPRWEPRRLTDYLDDDGQELGALAFLSDGERLVYRRGGGPNREGALPDPLSTTAGTSRDLYLIDSGGGEPVRIADGIAPLVSPADDRLVWGRGGSAYLLELGGSGAETRDPVELFRVRSGVSDLRWSPDGTKLAFASARDGRSILGVYDLTDETLRWLTNSVDQDRSPRWSPDGERIAFIRRIAGHDGFGVWTVEVDGESFAAVRRGGERARELWRAPDDPVKGRYPRAVSGDYDLMYGDGILVFPGEMSGWNHLYAIPEDGLDEGELPRDLTPGHGIVENATLSSDGRWVWVSTNVESIDTRQLGRVRLGDGHIEWIESGAAIAWNPAPGPDGEWIAYIRSDAREPASVYRRVLREESGSRLEELPDEFPIDRLVAPRQIVFPAADGLEIHGQLFVPDDLAEGERAPAVIFMHGGSRRQMLLGWHNRGYYHGAYAFNQFLASRGYVVLSVNYRSGIGYGVDFREPEDYGWRGASEYQDIVAAGRTLQTLPEVDPERIGLWGGSYGGYLTAMGLARDSELFRAGVDLHGVHDWSEQLRWYGRGEIRAPSEAERDRTAQVAFRSSPVADVEHWTSPVLFVHADDDRNVPFEATIDLVGRLRDKGDVHFEELYFVDDVHGFLLHRNWLEVFSTAADFFDRHLAGRRETTQ